LGDLGEFQVILGFYLTRFDDKELWEGLIIEKIARNFYGVIEKMKEKEDYFKEEQKELRSPKFGEFFMFINEGE
jgi:hypothetical protein